MINKRPENKRDNNLKTKIPTELIEAWEDTIIEIGKFPKGTRVSEHKPSALIKILAKYEKGTLIDLWKTFTSERDQLTTTTLTGKKEAVAYLLGFHLVNSARVIHTFEAAAKRWDINKYIAKQEKIRIIDLGCGSGAMAQANVAFVRSASSPDTHIQVRLIDGSSHLLDAAIGGIKKIDSEVNVRGHKGNLDGLMVEKYVSDEKLLTFINLGYVWNEIKKNRGAKKKINKLFSEVIKKDIPSLISIIEPGSQDQSRSAMELREELIDQGFMPLYPCPHSNTCPLLVKSRDWCYSEISWAHPPVQKFIDNLIGVERTRLAASAFLFASPALKRKINPLVTDMNIVVGRPTRNTSKEEKSTKADYLLCSKNGISKSPIQPNSHLVRRGDNMENPQQVVELHTNREDSEE